MCILVAEASCKLVIKNYKECKFEETFVYLEMGTEKYFKCEVQGIRGVGCVEHFLYSKYFLSTFSQVLCVIGFIALSDR